MDRSRFRHAAARMLPHLVLCKKEKRNSFQTNHQGKLNSYTASLENSKPHTSTRSNFYTGQKLGSKSHFYGRAAAEEVLASSLSALLRAGRARRGFSRSYHPVRGAARFVPKRAMLAVTSLSKQQMRSALALHAAASSMRGRRCDGRCGIGHRTTYRTPVIGRAALEEVLAHFLV